MNVFNNLKSIVKPVLKKLGFWQFLCRLLLENRQMLRTWRCNWHYKKLVRRARNKNKDEKIRVLFIVSEIAKWKEQSLYEVMEASGRFYPMVGISAWNNQSEGGLSSDEYEGVQKRAESFFDRLGDRHVRTVEIKTGKWIYHDLSKYNPDIIFYTEQWSPCPKQHPYDVSRYALTCFLPYYVPDFGITQIDCHTEVSRMSWVFFCVNESWRRLYRRSLWCVSYAAKFIITGHPALDYFHYHRDDAVHKGYVIYAPHFSFPLAMQSIDYAYCIGTFDWSGLAMLEYAEAHPEISWVYKPHPVLRRALRESGLMTEKEILDYYQRWERIAYVSTDADYQKLFIESRVIITDSGSFLPEYGSTMRPVIRLICRKNKYVPPAAARNLYDTYYNVHDLSELDSALKMVVEEERDPNAEIRRSAVKAAGLAEEDAAQNIVQYLLKTLSR